MKTKGENTTSDLLNSCRCCMFRKTDVNKRLGFSSLLWCLATWRREPSSSPRNSNVSICPPRGPGTCRRAALRRYISLLRLPGKSPRLFCVNPPQILQCYCVLRPPPFAPREYRPHYSCLHVKKKKVNQGSSVPSASGNLWLFTSLLSRHCCIFEDNLFIY